MAIALALVGNNQRQPQTVAADGCRSSFCGSSAGRKQFTVHPRDDLC
jgi:hypothetical protein